MKILLLPYSNQVGSTHTLVTIGKYLNENGVEVLCAGDGKFLKMASDNGINTTNLYEIPIDIYREKTDKNEFDYYSDEKMREVIDSEIALYKEFNPDFVISTLRFTAPISTKSAHVKHISLIYSCLTNYYALKVNIPETHPLYVLKKFPPLYNIVNMFGPLIKKQILEKYVAQYNKIASEYGVQPFINFFDLYAGEITWMFDTFEFAPVVSSTPPNYTYLGPIVNRNAVSIPSWIKEIEQKKKDGYKVVWISMGSSGFTFASVFKDMVEYIKDKKIVLIASQVNYLADCDYKSENIYLEEYIRADIVMPVCDLILTHGGRGTLYDSFSFNVPIIVIPHQSEQFWNGERVEELGLGAIVSKLYYSKKLLYKKTDKILGEINIYKRNVSEFSNSFKKYDWKKIVKRDLGL